MARVSAWRVERVKAREGSSSARDGACKDADNRRTFWWRVAARGSSFVAKIFGFCRSEHGGSPGIVRFLKFRTYLHRSEGGGYDFPKLVAVRGGAC